MGEEEDTDSTTESPRNNRASSGGSWPRPPSSARGGGGGGVAPSLQWPGAAASALPRIPSRTPPPPQIGDYRSEGEQPSTERDGSRRPLADAPRQDSFRTNRQPKRGGRKRLRRNMGRAAARRRIKIRVSSYCVAKGLHTIELLRWLESQPNRQLSQSLLARGNGAPPGRKAGHGLGSTRNNSTIAGSSDVAAEVESAGASRGGVPAPPLLPPPPPPPPPPKSGVDGLEWMDSLYIDVIHSTTDIKGGLRKARDLERPAWEEDEDIVDGEDGGGYGDGYGDGAHEEGGGPWERARADGEAEQEHGADVATRHKDVVFFPYGAVVFWGCSEAEVRCALPQGSAARVAGSAVGAQATSLCFLPRVR